MHSSTNSAKIVAYPEETEVSRVTNHAETIGFIFQETLHGREGHDKCLKREEADQSGGICGQDHDSRYMNHKMYHSYGIQGGLLHT